MKITLKAARVNAGYTLAQAAKLLDVSEQTIINWEKGRNYPDVRKVMKIEDTYGVPYRDILFE